jgi:hypothetical protein
MERAEGTAWAIAPPQTFFEAFSEASDALLETWDATDEALDDPCWATELMLEDASDKIDGADTLDATEAMLEDTALAAELALDFPALRLFAISGERDWLTICELAELAAEEMLSITGVLRPTTASETFVAAFSATPGWVPRMDSDTTVAALLALSEATEAMLSTVGCWEPRIFSDTLDAALSTEPVLVPKMASEALEAMWEPCAEMLEANWDPWTDMLEATW